MAQDRHKDNDEYNDEYNEAHQSPTAATINCPLQPLSTLNKDMHIYHASGADLPNIIAIYNQSVASKQATADLIPISTSSRQSWFAEHSADACRPIYVVKNSSEQLLAWGSFSNLYHRPAYHISSEISIYVHDKFQQQGIAKQLLTWMLTQAPSLGIYNVVALIFAHNNASLSLFRQLGFATWGMMPQVCDMDGFYADVVMLGKTIAQIDTL